MLTIESRLVQDQVKVTIYDEHLDPGGSPVRDIVAFGDVDLPEDGSGPTAMELQAIVRVVGDALLSWLDDEELLATEPLF